MINSLDKFIGFKQISIGSFRITYYALCILIGAILSYKLSQYFFKKKGYDPALLENLFYVAFPSGILGARIWWVIAEWSEFIKTHEWYEMFFIWEGGLAIQGGAIAGIGIGLLFVIKKYPNVPALLAADCIVPNILLGQAVGRWGNFFNQEVYGKCVNTWRWLPDFIEKKLIYKIDNNGYTGALLCGSETQMVVPLFLIESLINTLGFFVLMFGIPALFKWIGKISNNKIRLAYGDVSCSYLIWYGIVRAIMEPLRNPEFTMGSTDGVTNLTSVYMSIAFIVMGIAGIIICHIFRKKFEKPVLVSNTISDSEAEKESVTVQELNEMNEDEDKTEDEIQ